MSVPEYALRHLARPLAMGEPSYQQGLSMRTLDMAKLGQLYLQKRHMGGPADLARDLYSRRNAPSESGGPAPVLALRIHVVGRALQRLPPDLHGGGVRWAVHLGLPASRSGDSNHFGGVAREPAAFPGRDVDPRATFHGGAAACEGAIPLMDQSGVPIWLRA